MFWGLIMEPHRRYTQEVKKAFHVSMAALDASTSSEEPAQVMCGFEGRNYLLCTLKKPDLLQCPLDLNFHAGSKLSFAANGKCHVHLTGYLTDELPEEEEEEDDENEEEDEEASVEVKQGSQKRAKKEIQNGPPTKRSKTKKGPDNSDDSDMNIQTLLKENLEDSDDDDDDTFTSGDEDEEENEDEEAEDSDNEDEDEDQEVEDEEEEESSSLSEAESSDDEDEKETKQNKQKKAKVNGVPERQSTPLTKKQKKKVEKKGTLPKKKEFEGGVIVEDLKEGEGPPAKVGRFVNVYYEGRLKHNNKLFDSTSKGPGFNFRLGGGEVIKGWDVGLVGMKTGGKRRITCPPAMAYGLKGSPPTIPGNSTLVFEVELKKVR